MVVIIATAGSGAACRQSATASVKACMKAEIHLDSSNKLKSVLNV